MRFTTKDGTPYAGSLYVNVCGFHIPPAGCPMGYSSIGYIVDPKGPCFALSRQGGAGSTTWSYGPGDLGDIQSDGISIIGETLNTTIAFNTTLSIRCKDTVSGDPELDYTPQATANNSMVVILYHKLGCGKTIRGPFGFLSDFRLFIIPLSFILGCYLLVLGTKSIKVLLALLGGATGFILGSSLVSPFWKDGGKLETGIQFAVGFIAACGCGALAFYNKVVGRLLGGLLTGFILVLEEYYFVGYKMDSKGRNVD